MGTPYDRCIGAGRISIRECQLKFGAKKPVCNAQQRFEWFCGNLKELKTFFENTVQLQQQIVNEIFQRLQESFIKIRHIFEVSITFDHTHHQNNSKTMNSTELNRELDMQMNSQMQEFLLAFVCDEYCNVYLTHEFFSLDEELQRVGGPTALPLRSAEKVKYVELTSMRLLPNELSKMSQSVLFMIITSVQLFCICYTEYSLFWMLALMSYHSHKMAGLEAPPYTKIVIKRGGTIGEILRGLVHAFEPLGTKYSIDTTECLPTPVPPNFVRYYEIVVLCLLAWFLLFWEPYGLRLRHRIMSCFYPDASHKRAQYLHQRIVNDRGNFVKLARRRARALHLYADRNDAFWCLTWCCKIFGWGSGGFLGYSSGDICIICSKPLKRSEAIKCNTIGCKGIFCQLCFYESNYHCCLCSPPSSYGDYSDLSEIGDSSDDPDAEPFRPDNIYSGNASFDTLRKKSP
ncbi:DC-STAMP domain-containing protein 2-like [Scaptodrosophila lebanonensis]|uniref:DC-STAMP domain-containing protein 2-like n=1 Tax=Drosophila lebanonensis TaxID=7225 RepID=A0A6J2TJK7_DROLE|nr:DC-STAMP domain-containing protein 2-like [Scaptodrosophila lebanonensis]